MMTKIGATWAQMPPSKYPRAEVLPQQTLTNGPTVPGGPAVPQQQPPEYYAQAMAPFMNSGASWMSESGLNSPWMSGVLGGIDAFRQSGQQFRMPMGMPQGMPQGMPMGMPGIGKTGNPALYDHLMGSNMMMRKKKRRFMGGYGGAAAGLGLWGGPLGIFHRR